MSSCTTCVETIRNRLFCACQLPNQTPEKHIKVVVSDHHAQESDVKVEVITPGVVARLMGLESLQVNEKNRDSVHLRRSLSSNDYWTEFGPVQGFHRRVKTSVSFRDLPNFIEIDSCDFLGVRSEAVHEKMTNDLKERMPVLRYRRDSVLVQKQLLATAKPPRNTASLVPSPKNRPAEVAKIQRIRDREKYIKEEIYRCSLKKDKPKKPSLESLLINKPITRSRAQETSKQTSSNRRRKQPRVAFDTKLYSRHSKQPRAAFVTKLSSKHSIILPRRKSSKSFPKKRRRLYVVGKLEEDKGFESLICRPIETWRVAHFEEIGIEIEVRILDRLVHEVAAELCGLSMGNLGLLFMDDYVSGHHEVVMHRLSMEERDYLWN